MGLCSWHEQEVGEEGGDLEGGGLALPLVPLSASPGNVWNNLPGFSEPQVVLQDGQSTTCLRRNSTGWCV